MLTIPLISPPTSESCAGRFQNPGNLDVFQFLNAQGGVQMHINANGLIDPPLYPQTTVGTITSAQLLALNTNPVTLLKPPVANSIIIPQNIVLVYNFGVTPYSISQGGFASGDITVSWAPATSAARIILLAADLGFLDQSSSQIENGEPSYITILSEALGQAIVLSTTDTYTLGNGTLDYIMTYTVVAHS